MSKPTLAFDSNVVALPVLNLADVAGSLRNIADKLEAGEFTEDYGDVTNGCLVIEFTAGVHSFHYGLSDSPTEAIGLLELAKHRILSAVSDE